MGLRNLLELVGYNSGSEEKRKAIGPETAIPEVWDREEPSNADMEDSDRPAVMATKAIDYTRDIR